MADIPFSFSQVPKDPSFRNSAVNCVAVVPLLSSDKHGEETKTDSVESYMRLCAALQGQGDLSSSSPDDASTRDKTTTDSKEVDILLVVPNSSLTRPGDWRYQDTPLKSFHWQHGSQRLRLFDGRPQNSRLAHDRVMNHSVSRDWIDLCPSRRTAAVVGVLNMRDCKVQADLERAQEELRQWANRYATPPFEVTAHGRSTERDKPVERLFVFDSFDEEIMQNLDLTKLSASVLAFPPLDNAQMMDMHLNVVVNDLAVSVFRSLESKIVASDAICERFAVKSPQPGFKGFTKILQGDRNKEADAPTQPTKVSLTDMAAFVSPKSKLAKESSRSRGVSRNSSFTSDLRNSLAQQAPDANPKLLTPMDQFYNVSDLSPRDMEEVTRRDLSRREKWAADISLMAGSPLDAYERYLKAADMCRTGTPDPLWYASALEGCAAAHIAMAEAGGFGVDDYLEQNFQMPDEIMALAKEPRQQGNANRQVLPEVVFALCEEALNITNRHEKLAPLHSELLLKLADYVAVAAEVHLRCRWGEGPGCYVGESSDIPRWEKTSIFKMSFADPKIKGGSGDMIQINTFNRTKQVCELLQEAVSAGTLNPTTRVDVAARCARLCLDGVKATQWHGRLAEPVRLPRKAAFFAVVAAETMTVSNSAKSATAAKDLWLLATRLYSKEANSFNKEGNYGWAVLRATALDALSMQGNTPLSNQAAEDLLKLLSEVKFKSLKPGLRAFSSVVATSTVPPKRDSIVTPKRQSKVTITSASESRNLSQSLDEGDDDSERNTSSVGVFARQLRASFASITPNSTIITLESKWADGPVISPIEVPFADTSRTAVAVRNLGCVWLRASYPRCSLAQDECMQRITSLRRSLPTSSIVETGNVSATDGRLPIYMSSQMTILNEMDLAIERVNVKAHVEEDKGAMATFYNPYDKSKKAIQLVIVAEEEERFMVIQLGNRLSVPLEVQRCKLVFENNIGGRVKASALSFVMPPKVTNFDVHFPFSVCADRSRDPDNSVFEVSGIEMTFLGRVYFMPVFLTSSVSPSQVNISLEIPLLASAYPFSAPVKKTFSESAFLKPRFETCATQPHLQIILQKSGAPVESISTFSICLAEGEMFTMPSLELRNFAGPTLLGKIERLQIFVIDLPGVPETKIFDSDDGFVPPDNFFENQQMEEESAVPVRLRASTPSLTLEGINSVGSGITFQIAAANNMKKLLPDGAIFRLRFRYRGVSGATSEVWRRQEITYRVACVSGPRLSSMDFRPDLSDASAYEDMCRSLKERQQGPSKPQSVVNAALSQKVSQLHSIFRTGLDKGMHVASNNVVFLLTVANETKSEVILSSENGAVGGFKSFPIKKLKVHSGVSAKLPIVFPRLARINDDGSPIDLAQEVVSRTMITWTTECVDDSLEIATGQLRIPREALQDIIEQNPSFTQRISQAPCEIALKVGGCEASASPTSVMAGSVIDVLAEVSIAKWVPASVAQNCRLRLEFFCVRQGKGGMSHEPNILQDFVWVGKLQQNFRMDTPAMKHTVRIVFTNGGRYALSVCARIVHDEAEEGVEEVWWAPVAASFVVTSTHVSQ